MRSFIKKKHSFRFLNITQFLGALNDNVFKLIIVYFLISLQGIENASKILATTGAIFVVPFLLFSSAAGVMADRVSKRNVIFVMKIFEVLLMVLSIFVIMMKSSFGLYSLLFLLSTHSAIFGPSKYGIIPEIVDPKNVSKANGALNSLTYLAIIIGTFLGSFITDITNKNFVLADYTCVLIAVLGLLASLGIVKTPAKRSKKRINPLFIYEIYKTLIICSKKKYLISAVLGSAFFLFIGGFTQLNTIPFAIQSLGLSEVGGGYLFLATAVGIAIGSNIAGKISKDKVEPGMACLAGFFVSISFFLIGFFPNTLIAVIIFLVLLGFFGGIFLIPFDAFIQVSSPDKKRGRVIAAANFLSFCGVLLAAIFLMLISSALNLSAANGFVFIGILTLLFNIFITGRMSEHFFSFIARKILLKFYKIKIENIPTPSSYIVLLKGTWLEVLLLFAILPNLKIFSFGKVLKDFPFFRGFLNSLYLIKRRSNKRYSLTRLFAKTKKYKRRINYVCLFLDSTFNKEEILNFIKSQHPGTYPEPIFLNIVRKDKVINYNFTLKPQPKNPITTAV
ncbi:MAG: MFS transporter [Parachlamydiales bacterium]|jgi:acyl-[acyl-carrier-protein]-phospholipid O-acyltransferase/long-chain-fatty-acid--[acyl-carrier-protein] ligase